MGHCEGSGRADAVHSTKRCVHVCVSEAPVYPNHPSNTPLIQPPPSGFIAIDGTSLTICDVDQGKQTFSFMLIAHTQAAVILPGKPVGVAVNIEVSSEQ